MKINKPTLLIDKKKCKNNIKFMAIKAKANNLIFRPHFKTHQSHIVGNWFRDEGVDKITVSSVSMAKYFINDNWKNITIAFPFNILEIDEINKISEDVTLNLLIESEELFNLLSTNLKRSVNYFIKIDTGYNRTGLNINQTEEIKKIAELGNSCENLTFKGILSHFGQSYNAKSKKEIIEIYNNSVSEILEIKNMLSDSHNNVIVSVGDTPTCSIVSDFGEIDEIRPGNFVYFDFMQYYLGSCNFKQIAVALACPVVAKHENRNEIVIYGGAIHLSKEFVLDNNKKKYGFILELKNNKWNKILKNAYVISISQEHGVISIDKNIFNKINIGDIVAVMPIHSCLTAGLSEEILIV